MWIVVGFRGIKCRGEFFVTERFVSYRLSLFEIEDLVGF